MRSSLSAMTTALEMPHVTDCTATSCAYNHDGCHAYAVNIDSSAACGTFLSLNEKGVISGSSSLAAAPTWSAARRPSPSASPRRRRTACRTRPPPELRP